MNTRIVNDIKKSVTTSADQLFRGLPFTFESLASKNVMLFVHWNQMQVSSSHTFAFDSGKACYQIVLKNWPWYLFAYCLSFFLKTDKGLSQCLFSWIFIFTTLLTLKLAVHRTILAVLHFNENIQREKKTKQTGGKYMHVTYPKYKLGDEVVREVAVDPTYSMCLRLHFRRN